VVVEAACSNKNKTPDRLALLVEAAARGASAGGGSRQVVAAAVSAVIRTFMQIEQAQGVAVKPQPSSSDDDEEVISRVDSIRQVIRAQVAATVDGHGPHSATGLVPHDVVVRANAARHAFSLDVPFAVASMADLRSSQRGARKAKHSLSTMVTEEKYRAEEKEAEEKRRAEEDAKRASEQEELARLAAAATEAKRKAEVEELARTTAEESEEALKAEEEVQAAVAAEKLRAEGDQRATLEKAEEVEMPMRNWGVVAEKGVYAQTAPDTHAPALFGFERGDVVRGQQAGEWVVLCGALGYIRKESLVEF
jgi:Mg-chelatase subunit ChlI